MNIKSLLGFGKKKNLQKLSEKESETDNDGVIGEYYENGFPVIVKFIQQLPDAATQTQLSTLTVIAWKYDGSQRNGMPTKEINKRMINLEEAIENGCSEKKLFQHAYSRTGNNIKEFVYYCTSQTKFMQYLNKTLLNHDRYPIEIEFYEDIGWNEFRKLLDDFKLNNKRIC